MMKHILALVPFCLANATTLSAAAPKPLQVFILAGQSNMAGSVNVSTIDFLGEDIDPARAAMLKTFKPEGKTLVTRDNVWIANGGVYDKLGNYIGPEYALGYSMGEALEEQVLLKRAKSNQGFHYYGEGWFFILLGKSFAETMLELMRK